MRATLVLATLAVGGVGVAGVDVGGVGPALPWTLALGLSSASEPPAVETPGSGVTAGAAGRPTAGDGAAATIPPEAACSVSKRFPDPGENVTTVAVRFESADGIEGGRAALPERFGRKPVLKHEEVAGGPHSITDVVVAGGDGSGPEVGHLRPQDPGGRATVDVEFEPGLVELPVPTVDELGLERTAAERSLQFGWLLGTPLPGPDGVDHLLLHSTVDPDRAPGASSLQSTARGKEAVGAAGWWTGRSTARGATACAALLVLDCEGRILGRDELRETRTMDVGFEIEVAGLGSACGRGKRATDPVLPGVAASQERRKPKGGGNSEPRRS